MHKSVKCEWVLSIWVSAAYIRDGSYINEFFLCPRVSYVCIIASNVRESSLHQMWESPPYPPDPINHLCSLTGKQISENHFTYRSVQYVKSCSGDFILQNLILCTRLCGTGFITQHSCVLDCCLGESVSIDLLLHDQNWKHSKSFLLMYVCIYVYMTIYVWIHVFSYVYCALEIASVANPPCVCIGPTSNMYVYIHIYIYIYLCIYIHMWIYIYIWIYTYIYIYIYIYKCVY